MLAALDTEPMLPEPKPLAVLRKVLGEPLHGVRHVLVVERGGQHPGRAALEDLELGDLVNNCGDDLVSAGARTNDRHAFAAQVDGRVPFGRVHLHAGEGLATWGFGELRPIQLAHGGEHGTEATELPHSPTHGIQFPQRILGVPGSTQHLGVHLDVLADAAALGDGAGVLEDLPALGELLGPVVALGKGEGIGIVGGVEADARVGVLPPGAADFVALFEHRVGNPRLAHAVGGCHARHSGTDDRHGEFAPRSHIPGVPARRAVVLRHQGHVVHEHRMVGRVCPVGQPVQDLRGLLVIEHLGAVERLVADGAQGLEGQLARGLALRLGHASVRQTHGVHRRLRGTKVIAQHRVVPGDGGQGNHQRRQVRGFHYAAQKGVILRDACVFLAPVQVIDLGLRSVLDQGFGHVRSSCCGVARPEQRGRMVTCIKSHPPVMHKSTHNAFFSSFGMISSWRR